LPAETILILYEKTNEFAMTASNFAHRSAAELADAALVASPRAKIARYSFFRVHAEAVHLADAD
jgi:hypothetical protein